jgi:hypothetical protein
MREIRSSGSVRGVRRNPYPYRDVQFGEFRFSVLRRDHLLFSRSASQHDERIAASADVENPFMLAWRRL